MKHTLFFFILVTFAFQIHAQKVLNESETAWVNEAKADLERALSDPDMDENIRLKILKRSATTLKEYGQPSAFPDDEIALRKMMENNFDQCKNRISELSAMSLDIEYATLDEKLSLINSLQIEVAERQIQMILPGGNAAVSLSMELINTVFDVNIVEGVSAGQRGNAQTLKEKFIQLAHSKKLAAHINQFVENDRNSLKQLDKNRKDVVALEEKLKQAYKNAEASTIIMKGYQGAVPYGEGPPTKKTEQTPAFKANVLVGTWKFGYKRTGYFYWTFKNDGTWVFEDKMNDGNKPLTGRYSLSGNTLRLSGPKSECEDVEGTYTISINPEEFSIRNITDPCMSRRFTLNHLWTR